MYFPSKEQFLKLSKQGNMIPIYREILGDLETPVSAYFKTAEKAQYSFLLESVEGEEKVAQYSFLSKDPELVITSKDNALEISHCKNGKCKKEIQPLKKNNPLVSIREILSKYKFVDVPGLPRFCGGLVGFLGYDIVRFFEKLPNKPKDDLNLANMTLMMVTNLIIFDHRNHKIKIVSCAHIDQKATKQKKLAAYQSATKKIEKIIKELQGPAKSLKKQNKTKKASKAKSNVTEEQFKKMVTEAKKHIKAGDIIQTVLSQRFKVKINTNPFNIYRTLRTLNPSPYMFYLNFDKMQLVGSSPELLVRCENNIVETRPIAGTRPRGKDEHEDAYLAVDLLEDPKEKAEHIMLVDLGRNDLGRVCEKGSVHLSEFMIVEKYSHVMHIVSNVKGKLKKGNDSLDVLQAAFPAGTLSGAPKIRAMEIIDDLENVSRGPYGGCIGYFSFSGNLDTCITIRTIVVSDENAYVQAGAGIVADSSPQKEYQETLNKAKAQMAAIELAHRQFVC